MTHNPLASGNGDGTGNLFVDADPERFSPGAGGRTATATRARRGRGLVQRLDPPAPTPNAARFTLPSKRLARARATAHARIRRADMRAAALLRRLAARPYGALAVFAAVAAMLLALSWLGFALRATAAAHRKAVQRQDRTAAALTADHARIAALSAQLQQATVAAEQAHAQASAKQAPAAGQNSARSRAGNKH